MHKGIGIYLEISLWLYVAGRKYLVLVNESQYPHIKVLFHCRPKSNRETLIVALAKHFN